jgi:hypothetical protein
MLLFSRRFWSELLEHDRRLVAASLHYELAAHRFRMSRACITQDAQLEFRFEFIDSITELRRALGRLRTFKDQHALRDVAEQT